MALARACSLGRSLFSRGPSSRVVSSVFLSTRVTVPYRQFVSSSQLLQESLQHEPSRSQTDIPPSVLSDAQRSRNAQSVAVLRVPKRATRAEVEAVFKNAGLEVAELEMMICRFTFYNDCFCVVKLANEQQAERAVQLLNGNMSLGAPIITRPLDPGFVWGTRRTVEGVVGRHVFYDDDGITTAINPILEGRRIQLRVKTPGWGETTVSNRIRESREVIKRHFSKFGLESIGAIAPNYGDMKLHPRFLTFMDFTTKEGAEEAQRTMHDTEIEGRKVWLMDCDITPWKAYQIGRVDARRLADLQEKGLAPTEIDEEKCSKPHTKSWMGQSQKRVSTKPRKESA